MCSRIWLLSVIKTEDDVSQKSTNENASCYLLTKYLNFLASNIICDCLMTYIFVEVNLYLIRMSKLCYCHIHKIPYINLRYLIHTLSIPYPYPKASHLQYTLSIPYPYLQAHLNISNMIPPMLPPTRLTATYFIPFSYL